MRKIINPRKLMAHNNAKSNKAADQFKHGPGRHNCA